MDAELEPWEKTKYVDKYKITYNKSIADANSNNDNIITIIIIIIVHIYNEHIHNLIQAKLSLKPQIYSNTLRHYKPAICLKDMIKS